VREHNVALAEYGQAALARALGVDAAGLPGDPGVSMRLVPLPLDLSDGFDFQAVVSDRLGIETAVVPWNGHTLMRVSANVYNAPAEYDRLAEGLPGLL
jgi:isopenicillin-N epimerase